MIDFREVELDDAKLILDWRTKKRVTKYMNTDVIYDLEGQKNWLINSYNKKQYYHWIIQSNGIDVGLISIDNYNKKERESSWGLYIGNDDFLGVGSFAPLYLYNFLFNTMGVDSIIAEVFYDNINTIKLHLLHGYKFNPLKTRVISKNNKDVLLVNLTLHKKDFLLKRKSKYLSDFPSNKWEADN